MRRRSTGAEPMRRRAIGLVRRGANNITMRLRSVSATVGDRAPRRGRYAKAL